MQVLGFHTTLLWTTVIIKVSMDKVEKSCDGCPSNAVDHLIEQYILEDNADFSSLISSVRMPTMKRGTIKIDGFGK